METLLLTRTEVQSLLDPLELCSSLKAAFASYSLTRHIPVQRARSILPQDNASVMLLFPGLISNIPAYTVKDHAKFPSQSPSIKGVINLHDLETGQLLAIMDSTYITAVRTGLSGALGTHLLARRDAKNVTIIGAGVQGTLQLRSLTYFREISNVFVYDTSLEKATSFVKNMTDALKIPITICNSVEEAIQDSDIIISATWATEPFLFSSMVKKGVHITTLGPDEPGKCEVSAELIEKSIFVCDDRGLAVQMGAIGGVGLTEDYIHAEIGEVIANKKIGRKNDNQFTIYGSVGLAFQDLVGAWHVYQKAKQQNQGRYINFLG
ncbi:ornithine cyclodeaminase family protein [Lederbergia citri]|uniref:Ornithine cyclodeaminase family protein n=1 Tax=Lederbergia citri TaxID=2833580 RepID=A0A942TD76_9BACI|nr:ornithine cyclodeaminase family protein [Lederbergia citri]MBS4195761.1 ornithine cyclodeaminase family protein [Lederbergia citri]